MERFAAIAAMIALGLVQRFLYGFDHRWMLSRYDALVRSVAENPFTSTRDPWIAVGSGWYVAFWGAFGAQFVLLVWWLILDDTVAEKAVELVAYLAALFTAIGILGMSVEALVLHRRYRRLLRQAEAD
jgi:hypothetical protein